MNITNTTACTVVIETSDWQPDHRIQLWATLDEVTRQADALEASVIVVIDAVHATSRPDIEGRYPGIRVLEGQPGDGYYANKHRGIAEARTDLVVLTDANCRPFDGWLDAAVRAFETADVSVAAIQGRTSFDRDPLSRIWDAIWWARSTAPRGPLDRLYSANNLALRRSAYLERPYDLSWPHHTGGDRLLGRGLREAGYQLWSEPAMRVAHNYEARASVLIGLAQVRGYYFVESRRRPATPRDRLIRRLGWSIPLVLPPALWARDMVRVARAWRRVGLTGADAWKAPGYALALLVHALVASQGAVRALRGRRPYPRPS